MGLVFLLLVSGIPATAQASSAMPGLGMGMTQAKELTEAGLRPQYGSVWVGQWNAHDLSGLNSALRTGHAQGVTPVVYWYYWGDSISPSCVEYGCDGRTRAQWMSMTDDIARRIQAEMGGRDVVVVLENEFNKGGIGGTYAPTFDGYMETVAKKLKAVHGVRLVAGFGAWAEHDWGKFPKTIAQSDYLGFQMMRAQTRDTEWEYRAAPDRVAYYAKFIADKHHKPAFLYDVALSSYPDERWQRIQAETLSALLDRLPQTNVKGMVYRGLYDNPDMGLHNYYGMAERHWGLKTAQTMGGADKYSWGVWKAKAAGTALDVSFSSVKVDEWWVQAKVDSNKAISKVEARVGSGAWQTLEWKSYGWAKSINVKDGQTVTFRAVATDGSSVMSVPYQRGGTPAPIALSATFHDTKLDEWWVQVKVSANKQLSRVDARVEGGSWQALDAKSYGWSKSINVKTGQAVDFRATASDGTMAYSQKFIREGLAATFNNVKLDEWWVQTNVHSPKPLAKVDARVNGGAWQALELKSYGWAKSINVKTGQSVEFRATAQDGTTVISEKFTRNGPMEATFSGVKVDEWWVQTGVKATKPLASVDARVNGGSWVKLDDRGWGYAKSLNVKTGQYVEFRATATDGTHAYSTKHWR